MSVPPAPRTGSRHARFTLPRHAWVVVAVAFATGALLFLLLWLDQRGDGRIGGIDQPRGDAPGRVLAPLPAPAGGEGDARLRPGTPGDEAAALPAGPPPPPQVDAPAPRDAAPQLPPASTQAAQSEPVPVETPPPRYPPGALRAGTAGEVLLQIHVDARGLPVAVDVLQGSGSRELDRAAVTAVRRWRFRPAQRGGTPVAGTVNVPIRFESAR